MYHDHRAPSLAQLQADLVRDERALIAEGQRFVLHRGEDLIEVCRKVDYVGGEELAAAFRDHVLWSRTPPDTWDFEAITELLRGAGDLPIMDRHVVKDLLSILARLARNAAELSELRVRMERVAAVGCRLTA